MSSRSYYNCTTIVIMIVVLKPSLRTQPCLLEGTSEPKLIIHLMNSFRGIEYVTHRYIGCTTPTNHKVTTIEGVCPDTIITYRCDITIGESSNFFTGCTTKLGSSQHDYRHRLSLIDVRFNVVLDEIKVQILTRTRPELWVRLETKGLSAWKEHSLSVNSVVN